VHGIGCRVARRRRTLSRAVGTAVERRDRMTQVRGPAVKNDSCGRGRDDNRCTERSHEFQAHVLLLLGGPFAWGV
jgi:hypothetical protein